MSQIFSKIRDTFLKYEQQIVLIMAFCLISAISFEFGLMQGQKWRQKPLIVERPVQLSTGQENANSSNSEPLASVQKSSGQSSGQISISKNSSCAYVGSKNSDKFYLPTCSFAKRIKPENVVCFKSAQEALGQGRTESKCK